MIDERVDGDACQTGRAGRCGAGVTQCLVGEQICEQVAEAIIERCNGIDDDCDGRFDEELTPPVDPEATGVCQYPPGRCERGQWILSSIELLATYEVVELSCDERVVDHVDSSPGTPLTASLGNQIRRNNALETSIRSF